MTRWEDDAMENKYTFPEPSCRMNCPHFLSQGSDLCETRYCMARGGKGRRFHRKDPQTKAPRWCPKRIKPVCRVYTFADPHSKQMELCFRSRFDPRKDNYLSAAEWHFKLRLEIPLGMKAKAFYEAAREEGVESVLENADLQFGEIIEIDDGLKPYYFYYFHWPVLIPIYSFDRTKTVQQEDGHV